MKKILVIFIISVSSIFLFSAEEKEQVENKKLGIEVKTMINAGFEAQSQIGDFFVELDVSKRFDVEKINTIFNVGGGIDFANYFNSKRQYSAVIAPYFLTEVGGYISKDTRLYTNMKTGVGVRITPKDNGGGMDNNLKIEHLPKFELGLGVLYKHLSAEISYNYPIALTLGLGARFGF